MFRTLCNSESREGGNESEESKSIENFAAFAEILDESDEISKFDDEIESLRPNVLSLGLKWIKKLKLVEALNVMLEKRGKLNEIITLLIIDLADKQVLFDVTKKDLSTAKATV